MRRTRAILAALLLLTVALDASAGDGRRGLLGGPRVDGSPIAAEGRPLDGKRNRRDRQRMLERALAKVGLGDRQKRDVRRALAEIRSERRQQQQKLRPQLQDLRRQIKSAARTGDKTRQDELRKRMRELTAPLRDQGAVRDRLAQILTAEQVEKLKQALKQLRDQQRRRQGADRRRGRGRQKKKEGEAARQERPGAKLDL